MPKGDREHEDAPTPRSTPTFHASASPSRQTLDAGHPGQGKEK
jgi:hypothetical protein